MPKRKWNEEELRRKALELRRQGKSYREIAKEIGCSVFTVSRILSPFENPQSRLKQAAELAMKVEEISKRIDELTKRLEDLKPIEELKNRLSKVETSIKDLEAIVKKVANSIDSLDGKMGLIERSVSRRLRDDWNGCRHMDKNGYCTEWRWRARIKGWDMRESFWEGKTVYYLNVKKHPLICTACPSYSPRE